MFASPPSDEFASFLLLGGSAVAAYAAVRGLTDALFLSTDPAPGKRAILHSTMVLVVSVAAILHRPPLLDVAVGLPFSATVAALTLALGVVLFVSQRDTKAGTAAHPIWSFVLPTALLTLLIGFGGTLTLRSGLVLIAEGAAIVLVATGSRSRVVPALDTATIVQPKHRRPVVVVQAICAFALALIAGWGMVQGAGGLALHNPAFRPGVAAALALGPAIVLPMIPPIATLAERGKQDEAISALVGFALLNLCVALPLVIVAHRLLQNATPFAATQPTESPNLSFPILVWRLDTVLISTVGLLLVPAAIGRWTLSRAQGTGLICIYVSYLFLTLVVSHN